MTAPKIPLFRIQSFQETAPNMLVNASVYDHYCSRSVLPWTIFDVGDDSLSLSGFYQLIVIRHSVQVEEHELREARVGKSKESLDSVSDHGEG